MKTLYFVDLCCQMFPQIAYGPMADWWIVSLSQKARKWWKRLLQGFLFPAGREGGDDSVKLHFVSKYWIVPILI